MSTYFQCMSKPIHYDKQWVRKRLILFTRWSETKLLLCELTIKFPNTIVHCSDEYRINGFLIIYIAKERERETFWNWIFKIAVVFVSSVFNIYGWKKKPINFSVILWHKDATLVNDATRRRSMGMILAYEEQYKKKKRSFSRHHINNSIHTYQNHYIQWHTHTSHWYQQLYSNIQKISPITQIISMRN